MLKPDAGCSINPFRSLDPALPENRIPRGSDGRQKILTMCWASQELGDQKRDPFIGFLVGGFAGKRKGSSR